MGYYIWNLPDTTNNVHNTYKTDFENDFAPGDTVWDSDTTYYIQE